MLSPGKDVRATPEEGICQRLVCSGRLVPSISGMEMRRRPKETGDYATRGCRACTRSELCMILSDLSLIILNYADEDEAPEKYMYGGRKKETAV